VVYQDPLPPLPDRNQHPHHPGPSGNGPCDNVLFCFTCKDSEPSVYMHLARQGNFFWTRFELSEPAGVRVHPNFVVHLQSSSQVWGL
jgi:hypothetical protein